MYKKECIQSTPVNISFYYGWVIVAMGALGLFLQDPDKLILYGGTGPCEYRARLSYGI